MFGKLPSHALPLGPEAHSGRTGGQYPAMGHSRTKVVTMMLAVFMSDMSARPAVKSSRGASAGADQAAASARSARPARRATTQPIIALASRTRAAMRKARPERDSGRPGITDQE